MEYLATEPITLKAPPQFNEKWFKNGDFLKEASVTPTVSYNLVIEQAPSNDE